MRLFDRTNRRVSLTPAGRVFRLRAKATMELAEKAVSETKKASLGEAGTLSLGFVSAALFGILPALLSRFRRHIPAARLELEELDPAEQLDALRSERIDLGIMHAEVRRRELETRIISREKLVVALPSHHPAARERRVNLRALSGERMFLPRRHEFLGFHDQIMQACHNAGFVPASTQATRLLLTAVYLVSGRQGIALVPESFRNQKVPGVAYRPLRGAVPVVELVAVWRKSNQAPLLLRMVEELDGICLPR